MKTTHSAAITSTLSTDARPIHDLNFADTMPALLPHPLPSTRRQILRQATAIAGATCTGVFAPSLAQAQTSKVRVGIMLPFTGTYAQLGTAIENGFRLALKENGGKLGGRDVEFFRVDDESDPAKGIENANKLVQRDKVDVIVGTVHSGVQMGIHKVARESGVLSLIPNAGLHAATRSLCAINVFRTSFASAQTTRALGKAMMDKGHKRAVWLSWKYAAGDEMLEGFKEGYLAAGGVIMKELSLPFPSVEFQALLTEIAALKPDAIACFFSGGGAVKFLKDYAAAGLQSKIPLYGSGFLTEGTLEAAGAAAEGVVTTLHYSDTLNTPRNKSFRLAYAKEFKLQPDVFSVQGYDTGLLLIQGAHAVKGDFGNKAALYKALENAHIDSPRGTWTISKAHNPVQDIYLRVVKNKENKVLGVVAKALADSGEGCKL